MTARLLEPAGTAERGDRVAWTIPPSHTRSAIHRALNATYTFCSRVIPHDRRIGLMPSLQRCQRCEAMWKRAEFYRTHPDTSTAA